MKRDPLDEARRLLRLTLEPKPPTPEVLIRMALSCLDELAAARDEAAERRSRAALERWESRRARRAEAEAHRLAELAAWRARGAA
jgi:hypothetical protein